MPVPLSPVTILTEDWFYVPDEDEPLTADIDPDELDDQLLAEYRTEADDYADVPEWMRAGAEDELAYLHREEDEARIIHRWSQPDDVLEVLDYCAEHQPFNHIILTMFRRAALAKLLRVYLGASYASREIVTRWEQVDGRWLPAEKLPTLAWVSQLTEEKGQLAGLASACATIQYKLLRKGQREFGPTSRVLSSEEVRAVVARAIQAESFEADHSNDVSIEDAVAAFIDGDDA